MHLNSGQNQSSRPRPSPPVIAVNLDDGVAQMKSDAKLRTDLESFPSELWVM
jgi:hypothetical protein